MKNSKIQNQLLDDIASIDNIINGRTRKKLTTEKDVREFKDYKLQLTIILDKIQERKIK
jgi:hypothetical protein